MSSIINKIKEAVHSDKHDQPEGTSGPHNSRVANAADPRVDSDRDGSHTAGRTAGHNDSGLGSSGTAEGIHGPHSSRAANAMDPRVDSDRDGSNTYGNSRTTGYGTASSGFGTGHNTAEGAHGPHSSRVANAMDPRVDSDRDGSRTAGNSATTGYGSSGLGHSTGTHGIGSTGTHGIGSTGTHGIGSTGTHGEFGSSGLGSSGTAEGIHGPHNSRVGNAMDPRVDSDRDGSHTAGRTAGHNEFGTHGVGSTGTHTAGTHNAGNHFTSGPGPAPHTAGPHSNDMANKLDPRVDSDRDGSKTLGADRTYQESSLGSRDPHDAAQVPPSVMRKVVGEPIVEHDDHHHHRERRNSVKSHQERFSGI
ncbi:hypothetical protein QBC42DRAFT_198961 [Cladorrhinum samala]|uniref:Cell surface protein n=1 Tax=Cladorrhinum samala TaxID=585594 RepID=A0AAV9HRS8_9PEZI|nr:hypothetical protein QBC42DRAFT_198961 [Cladorrhinum samala]